MNTIHTLVKLHNSSNILLHNIDSQVLIISTLSLRFQYTHIFTSRPMLPYLVLGNMNPIISLYIALTGLPYFILRGYFLV